jgi:hypothetical protein
MFSMMPLERNSSFKLIYLKIASPLDFCNKVYLGLHHVYSGKIFLQRFYETVRDFFKICLTAFLITGEKFEIASYTRIKNFFAHFRLAILQFAASFNNIL